jgi:hypothetical protein
MDTKIDYSQWGSMTNSALAKVFSDRGMSLLLSVTAGSYAYNLNTPQSDHDFRGIFKWPSDLYLRLVEPPPQISNESGDVVYYSLKRFFDLAKDANPNIIELLWIEPQLRAPIMDLLIINRHLFVSKKAYHTFSGYAYAQIKKAKGQNKMVNHPELAEKPAKEDFCWVIPSNGFPVYSEGGKFLPSRPIPYKKLRVMLDLGKCHCAALEHVSNTYRLYHYGDSAKGVFRGDDMLVCESIPIDDEAEKFVGLLIYNKHEYEKALIEHRKYTDWIQNRNDARWVDQEKGLLDFDGKNMMHCMRLLLSGESILRNGCPIVRFEGERRQFLLDVRHGQVPYDTIMKLVEQKMADLESLYNTCSLQHGVDMKKIEMLYQEMII